MRRTAAIVVALAVLAAMAALGAVSSSAAPGKAHATTLTVWVGWSARELSEFKKVTAEYDAKNPNVSVKVVGGINDDKIIAALRSGNAPDVVSSFTSSNVGIYCSSGGWIDLAPYLKKDGISTSIFPAATMYYTQFKGTRCALPLLADVYGFYYNKALFKKAGLTAPPKTFAELTAYAKKLTTRKGDGSLDVVGFDPVFGFYQNGIGGYQPLVGAKYFDPSGKSAISRDPGWKTLLNWQRGLIDYYGYGKLVRWQTGAGDEFSASHAFERGKLAMMMDGEWRVAFLAAEHPELKYGTAPMPAGLRTSTARLHQRHHHRDPEGGQEPRRGLEARQVPDDEQPRTRELLERDPERAVDGELDEVQGAQARRELRHVREAVREPEVVDDPDHRDRCRPPPDVPGLHRQVAGGKGQGPARRSRGGRQADRREAEAGGRRRELGAVSSLPVTGAGPAAVPAVDRRRARRRAGWRRRLTVLAFLSPWLAGFAIFFGYPLAMTTYLSFFHYDLLNPPRWVGLANYRYLFGQDAQIWPAVENTLVFIPMSVPLQVLFAFGIAVLITRARRGSASSGRSSTSPRSCRRSPRRSGSSIS